MHYTANVLLLLISFAAGILTVLAPCVLPLLPVIIGGSLGGKNKERLRPYLIAVSLAGSIIVFTLLLKVSTVLIHVPPSTLTAISGGLIIILGIFSLFPEVWEKIIIRLNWQAGSQRLLGKSERNTGKWTGPILIGIALGPVFSSCSPTYAYILASVLPKDFLTGLSYLIAYSLGLVLTLLIISLVGRHLIAGAKWAVDTHGLFRRALGALFIIIGVVIISGQALKTEVWIANHVPIDETKLEQILLKTQHKQIAPASATSGNGVLNVSPTPAPALAGLTNWINSRPLTLSALQGHVVLIDFWTYSCVNCNRALPYVEKWYQTYKKDGFVVIGVHTPEFAFEHIPANVEQAVKTDDITYPVALDNNYATWNAFDNDSWPADYLIDKTGNIRYISLGEGGYNVTEEAIQQLLGIHAPLQTPTSVVPISANQTNETYFGLYRTTNYSGQPNLSSGQKTFTPTPLYQLAPNAWTLGGSWQIGTYNITSASASATLSFSVNAKDVYMVAGSQNNKPETVSVGLPNANAGEYGTDAPKGQVIVNGSRLYHIVSLKAFGSSTVTLTVPVGVSLYTFTFGS